MNTRNRCAICRRQLTEAEIEGGLVVRVEEGVVCERCTPEIEDRFAGGTGAFGRELAEESAPADETDSREGPENEKYDEEEFEDEGEYDEDENALAIRESERTPTTDEAAAGYDEEADEESSEEEAKSGLLSDAEEGEIDEEEDGEGAEGQVGPVGESPPVQETPRSSSVEEEILRELRAISNTLLYEKASIWNVFGGISQVLVLGVLILAVLRWETWGEECLLLAVLLQLATLTFFIKGK